jgi:hypothetical protein
MKKSILAFLIILLFLALGIYTLNLNLFSIHLPYSSILGTTKWFIAIFGNLATQVVFAFIISIILNKITQIQFFKDDFYLGFLILSLLFLLWGLLRLSPTICLDGNCKTGTGILVYLNGDKYEGILDNYKPQGIGKLYYKNSKYFEGYFEEGLPHGEGFLLDIEDGKKVKIKSIWFRGKINDKANVQKEDGSIEIRRYRDGILSKE